MIYRDGWQTSRGHKGQIFVDKKGEFSWTLLVNEKFSFWAFWAALRSFLKLTALVFYHV